MKADYSINISGRVQGVFYRATAKKIADELGLKGWIKNNSDESVTAYVSGEEEKIMKFIRWCRQGPEMAEVRDVQFESCKKEDVSGFEIRRS